MRKINRREFLRQSALAGMGAALAACSGPWQGRKAGGSDPDILIKGGMLYDGSTDSPHIADVGIKGDRITAIGDLTANGARVIDAKGLIVAPGFIDIHTHIDMDFTEAGGLEFLAYVLPEWKQNRNYLYQGVTTVVSGNCGYGRTSTKAWFDQLRSLNFGTNVYHLAPHGVIRTELFGEDQPAELSPEQMKQFRQRIAQEMEEGAVGLSTGLEYAPGVLTSTQELIELAKIAGEHGGLYATHIRSFRSEPGSNGQPAILTGLQEAIEIGRAASVPVQLSHLQIHMGSRYPVVEPDQVLGIIEQARAEGMDVTADQYPYAAGYSMISTVLPGRFKSERGVREEYWTPEGKQEIKKAIQAYFVDLPPEKFLLLDGKYAGKTVLEVAQAEEKDPADAYVDLVTQGKSPTGIFFQQDMDRVRQLAQHEYVFTASDGLTHIALAMKAHPRFYGTFTRKIQQFALEEKLMDLNTAIRSMTSLPAEKYHMKDRGRISEGYYADITVFDPTTIADRSTYEKADVLSKGINYLLVNGALAIDHEQATGVTAGRPLKRGE